MSNKTFTLDERLYDYLLAVSLREPPILAELRRETRADPLARMQIAPEQGQFMALLAKLTGAKRYLEIGVYTGYSSLWMALALPEDGSIVACDVSEEWTSVARRYWERAGVGHKIELRLAPALVTLDELIAAGEAERFDLAFIDADKENYWAYFERCLELVRPGGLIAIDNTLWSGKVADPDDHEPTTEAVRAFNRRLWGEGRVELSLVPIGDGLTLALKKP
ncbi:class I SAM-dependent methyltransferase [Pelomicrobium methylotrophicum]|uniref:SAM-dependent methyltransferase n=1 Tax=Pelomicrobium methylotrophicum TaxID=2602750 RepID=A0A5C7EMZ4_9PROT|nr:class I SAM-dependent methyltransferase [Pelomicrobium methylotrophicum]TXF13032.1 SAM-dependent methyltransferase [Pelomicrobium methylotrophicum]